MATIQFSNGIKVNFEGEPTQEDIEEVAKNLSDGGVLTNENAGVRKADSSSLLSKTSKVLDVIFGGGKIGEAIGTGLAKTKIGRKLVGAPELTEEEQKEVAPGPTAGQVAGDIAGVGLTLAGLGGVGTTGSFTARLLKTMGLGAGISGAKAISEGEDAKEVTKSTIAGGAVGVTIPIAGAGLRAIGRQIEKLPARFVNSALSRSKKQVLNDIAKDKIDDFANYVVKSKPIGSANKLLNESSDNVEKLSGQINEALSSAIRKGGLKVTIGRDNLLDEIVKLPEAEGALLKRSDIQSIIEKLAPQTKKLLQKNSLTLTEANKLRQLVDRTLGDRGFLSSQLSTDKVVLKTFANTLRESVKEKAPEGTRDLFLELTNEIRFRDGLLSKIAQRAGNQVLSFGDFIGGGLGGIFGSLGAQPITGAVAGVATRRAIESVPFKIGSAKIINALTKAAPVLDALAPAQQTAILKLFSEIFVSDKSTPEQAENQE